MPRSSQAEAARTRAAVLDRAVDLGSTDGLEGVTIGRLADELSLSKSGVIGPFGSKEALQLATFDAAIERFRAEVWEPVAALPSGRERLLALVESWFSYLERDVFPGGCFLTAATHEFDGRPGPVRDAVVATWERWIAVLEREIAAAQQAGDLDAATPAAQLAFQLHAYVVASNWTKQLFGAPGRLEAGRAAAAALLALR